MHTLTPLQLQQRHYMNHIWTPPAFVPRNTLTPLADYIAHSTLIHCRELLPADLSKHSFLFVNCGSGVDTDFFASEGAGRVMVTDLSERAVRLAHEHNARIHGVSATTEQLPFADGAFDFVGVRSGLHHLDDPYEGLREMARVAKLGVFFIEGQKTSLVPMFARVGMLEEKEEAGNTVYRFTREELQERLPAIGIARWDVVIGSFLQVPALLKLARHVPGKFSARLWRGLVRALNIAWGRWGNAFIVVAWK